MENVLRILPVVPFDLDTARVHARLWARLEEQGNLMGAHDLFIVATCVQKADSIATLNRHEFSRIIELNVIDCSRWDRS